MSWSWPRRSGCGCGPCCGVAKLPFHVTRARVLLKADEGYTDGAIAAALEVATATVGRIRKRLVEEGLEHALREQPRPGQRRKLSGKQGPM